MRGFYTPGAQAELNAQAQLPTEISAHPRRLLPSPAPLAAQTRTFETPK
jgi:hypothetical protein